MSQFSDTAVFAVILGAVFVVLLLIGSLWVPGFWYD